MSMTVVKTKTQTKKSKKKKNEGKEVNLNVLIPQSYLDIFALFMESKRNEYVTKGGRGGIKSTIASYQVVLSVLFGGNALCIRRYKNSLRGSSYNDIAVAMERLGVSHLFKATTAPLEYTHIPSGRKIFFRGLDDPQKIKSLKVKIGHISALWFEECQEIENYRKCRTVIQTVARGKGVHCNILYSFNPPPIKSHWVNTELSKETKKRAVLHVNYTDIPAEWLGEQFIEMAEELKELNFDAYRNEYLGEVAGTKGMVFPNVRPLPPDLVFDKSRVRRGLDYSRGGADPHSYVSWYYDRKQKIIVLKGGYHKTGDDLDPLAEAIKLENVHDFSIITDVEGIYNNHLNKRGINGVRNVSKTKEFRSLGIRWLRNLKAIYIDKDEFPDQYKEWSEYEYATDKNGEYTGSIPDGKDHSIDATRYAFEDEIKEYV